MTTKSFHLDMREQIECAQTLASRFYTDPAILEVEKPRIFQRTWQLVGTLHQPCGEVNGIKRTISDPESFFTVDVVGEPVIVVRDKQGTLRAFSNVCRHRAGPIALGSGCKNVLRCQYRLDLYPRWPPDWHSGRRWRRVLRPQLHGHGPAALRNLGPVHFCELRSPGRAACRVPGRNSRAGAWLPIRGPGVRRAPRLCD